MNKQTIIKNNKKICKIIFFILIILIVIAIKIIECGCYLKSSTKNAGINTIDVLAPESTLTYGSVTDKTLLTREAYEMTGYTAWCGWHGRPLARRIQNIEDDSIAILSDGSSSGRQQELTYQLQNSNLNISQSIAYAYNFNKGEDLQTVIWASGRWSNSGYCDNCLGHYNSNDARTIASGGLVGRSEQFANFQYRALGKDEKLGMHCTPTAGSNNELKILVNQTEKTYTVGPYTVDFTPESDTTLEGTSIRDLVYNEIIGAYDQRLTGPFCTGTFNANVIFKDGTTETNANIIIIDSNGNQISNAINFPRFGQEFYIQYKTSVDAETVNTIIPNISVNYMKKIKSKGYTYISNRIRYTLHDDVSGFVKDTLWKDCRIQNVGDNFYYYYDARDGTTSVPGDTSATSYILNPQVEEDTEQIKEALYNRLVASSGEGSTWEIKTNEKAWLTADENYYIFNHISEQKYEGSYAQVYYTTTREYVPEVPEKKGAWRPTGYDFQGRPTGYYWDPDYVTQQYQPAIPAIYEYMVYAMNRDGSKGALIAGTETSPEYNTILDASEAGRNWMIAHLRIAFSFKDNTPLVTEETNNVQSLVKIVPGSITWNGPESLTLGNKIVNMYIGGNVWTDTADEKTGLYSGTINNNEQYYKGMQVRLWDVTKNKIVATTTTNNTGQYGFKELNPMHDYRIEFTYNGMLYEATYYKDDLSGGYSNAMETTNTSTNTSDNRNSFNSIFETIDSTGENYYDENKNYYDNNSEKNKWSKAYGYYTKIEDISENYIKYTPTTETNSTNAGAFRFCDALEILRVLSVNTNPINNDNEYSMQSTYYNIRNYGEHGYSTIYSMFIQKLKDIGVTQEESNNILNYVKDTLISSYTYRYPRTDKFVLEDVSNPPEGRTYYTVGYRYEYLYTKSSDQSRNVDFGVYVRDKADLAIQKDVYKATVLVNGKEQDYVYNKKNDNISDDGSWDISTRVNNDLYNGNTRYTREIRKSEYLFDGNTSYNGLTNSSAKNLQIYVTYRIAIKNQSSYDTRVNEIVDYYDESKYEFDGIISSDGVTYAINTHKKYNSDGSEINENVINARKDSSGNIIGYVDSYVGDSTNNAKSNTLTVKTVSSLSNRNTKDTTKHLTGAGYDYTPLYLTGITSGSNSQVLHQGELTYVYVTFKVKQDDTTGKPQLDEELYVDANGNTIQYAGKRNIAEINSYSTYYKDGATIPDTLNNDNSRNDKRLNTSAEKIAGSVEKDSNPGSLKARDLDGDGDIITSNNPVDNRLEDDVDKAPNIKIIIDINKEDTRSLTGYVYEDNRTEASDGALIGNGKYDSNETKINGVTVQLVELIRNVNEEGIFTGSYSGEKVWNSVTYTDLKTGTNQIDDSRYYSGSGTAKVILMSNYLPTNAPTGATSLLTIDTFQTGNGEYGFTSLPAGDFFIRFTYGDTSQTVLTTAEAENNSDSAIEKATNEKVVNDLVGYSGLNVKSYNGQDYKSTIYQSYKTATTQNIVDQNSQYNGINGYYAYDTQNYTDRNGNINNGTDKSSMYYYNIANSMIEGISDAKDVSAYRLATNNYSKGANGTSLMNNRAEVLASFEKLGTYTGTSKEEQKKLQLAMLQELIDNTKMVAQTGIISTEVERNTNTTTGQGTTNNIPYIINDIDLGLVERPEAQLKLTKEVTNFKLTLSNNQVLFDANQSVYNLSYGKHTKHSGSSEEAARNGSDRGYRLQNVRVNSKTATTPELLQCYIDDELMAGSTVRVDYKITVENIGEIDYLDNTFYYTGKTNNTNETNISRTNANTVIDYVSNLIKYNKDYQKTNAEWNIKSPKEITNSTTVNTNGSKTIDTTKIDSDFVNREYADEILTYNTILTTNILSGDLLPQCLTNDKSKTQRETSIILSTLLAANNKENDLVYNNLTEIIEASNSQGRRMQYSIVGNQEISDQSLGNNASTNVYTNVDYVIPTEIDADSAQKVVLMPPTGANKNYLPIIVVTILSLTGVVLAVIIIKRKI